MINWRTGIAGFVGAYRTLIKGVFNFQHSLPAVGADTATFAVQALIDGTGESVEGIIDSTGQSVEALFK